MNHTDTYTLREAKPEDGQKFAKLMLLAGGEMFPFMFGQKTEELFATVFKTPDNLNNYQNTQVICKQGNVVGMCSGFSYPMQVADAGTTDKLYEALLGPRVLWVMLVMSFLPHNFGKAHYGEFYINSIAIFPANRGSGLGTRLIDSIEKKARSLGMSSLVLDVDVKNSPAIQFYLHKGFSLSSVNAAGSSKFKAAFLHLFRSRIRTVQRMEKRLL